MRAGAAGDRLVKDVLLLWDTWTQSMRWVACGGRRLKGRAGSRICGRLSCAKTW